MNKLCFIFFVILNSVTIWAANDFDETLRSKGFFEHQRYQKNFDKERSQAETRHYAEKKEWDDEQERQRKLYKKNKKAVAPMDETSAEYKDWLADKKQFEKEYDDYRRMYSRYRKSMNQYKESQNSLSEVVEFDLNSKAPRYDTHRRSLYTGRLKFGKWSMTVNGSGGTGSRGRAGSINSGGSSASDSFNNFNNNSFENFGGDGGYIPPPPMPEPYYDPSFEAPPTMPNEFGGDEAPAPPPPPFNDGFAPDFGG